MVPGLGNTGPGGCGPAKQGRFREASAPALGSPRVSLGCSLPRPQLAYRAGAPPPPTPEPSGQPASPLAVPTTPRARPPSTSKDGVPLQLVRPQLPSYVQPSASCPRSAPPGRKAPRHVRDIPAPSLGRAPGSLTPNPTSTSLEIATPIPAD